MYISDYSKIIVDGLQALINAVDVSEQYGELCKQALIKRVPLLTMDSNDDISKYAITLLGNLCYYDGSKSLYEFSIRHSDMEVTCYVNNTDYDVRIECIKMLCSCCIVSNATQLEQTLE